MFSFEIKPLPIVPGHHHHISPIKNLGRVEPNIGVDNDDVSRIEGGLNLSMTGHPTLWWRSKPPGLHTPQLCLLSSPLKLLPNQNQEKVLEKRHCRYLYLPAGEINIVHMVMGTRTWGACKEKHRQILRKPMFSIDYQYFNLWKSMASSVVLIQDEGMSASEIKLIDSLGISLRRQNTPKID